jgi:hypothetical protein
MAARFGLEISKINETTIWLHGSVP